MDGGGGGGERERVCVFPSIFLYIKSNELSVSLSVFVCLKVCWRDRRTLTLVSVALEDSIDPWVALGMRRVQALA